MLRSPVCFVAASFIVVSLSDVAAAQAGSDTTRTGRVLDPMIVTASPEARPSAITLQSGGLPTAVTVITRDQLTRTNVGRDFGSLLRRVPGIMAHNIGQGDTGDSEKMRGFLSSSHGADVAVYIDGVPQNVPSASINHGMNDMSWLTPDMIERIDIIKGPFSAMFGDQNRSGAMNIITRSRAENSIGGTFGSFGTKRGALVLSGADRSIQIARRRRSIQYRRLSRQLGRNTRINLREGIGHAWRNGMGAARCRLQGRLERAGISPVQQSPERDCDSNRRRSHRTTALG